MGKGPIGYEIKGSYEKKWRSNSPKALFHLNTEKPKGK